jgi:diguanylate cyclase
VSATGDDHEHTLTFADLALDKIKDLGQTADPRNYSAWFTYATNCNPSRNTIVNETVARKGNISPAELEKVYGYAPPNLISDNVDKLAASVADEVEQVMAMIDAAVGTVATYRDDLSNVTEQLDSAHDRDGLRAIVESLVEATKSMEATNQALTASLKTSKQEISQLQEKVESLRIDSLTDSLTSLANRKYFDRELERCMAEADATTEGLCLLLLDIDHFKTINDTFGHMAGDEVLRVVAHSLKQLIQPDDVAARLGGEEFAVILPKVQLRSALTVADHIRCRVMAMQFMKRSTGESLGRVTISGGVAAYRKGEGPWALVHRADNCLYAAKRNGRNRVICDNDTLAAAVA